MKVLDKDVAKTAKTGASASDVEGDKDQED